jgi:hypothetical protein
MSAFPSTADVRRGVGHVSFVPEPDIGSPAAARAPRGAMPLSSVMNSRPSSRIRISCYRLAAGRSPTGTTMCAYGVPFHMT